ncbi:MAG: hypothetical protein OXF01_19075 [Gemmatimonadetes bacterium]|nr:hypothetical protein [Gemmatimonadota bacterium]
MTNVTRTLPPALCGLGLWVGLPEATSAQEPEELTVVEVWTTEGIEIADGLTAITGLVEAADGRIWIADMWPLEGRVLVLDPESMRAEVVGRKGDGPGEVLVPTSMTIMPDGRIAVYDMLRRAVEIYDPDGEPFRRVQLRGVDMPSEKGFAALPTGGFLVTGSARPSEAAIHYFDNEGEWVRGWRERYPPRDAFPVNESEVAVMMAQQAGTGGPVHALPDGSFLYSQSAPHEIVLFERSSTRENDWTERPVVSMPELFEPPGITIVEESNEGGWIFRDAWPRSMYVFGLGNGYILNVVDMGEEERWLWQVFDPQRGADGEAALVAQASLDRRYTLKSVCENGDILAALANPDTGVSHAVRLRLEGLKSATRREAGPGR